MGSITEWPLSKTGVLCSSSQHFSWLSPGGDFWQPYFFFWNSGKNSNGFLGLSLNYWYGIWRRHRRQPVTLVFSDSDVSMMGSKKIAEPFYCTYMSNSKPIFFSKEIDKNLKTIELRESLVDSTRIKNIPADSTPDTVQGHQTSILTQFNVSQHF